MIKYTLYVGLNDKDTKQQIITTEEAKKIIVNTSVMFTEGVTISENEGIFKHADGTLVFEKTIKCEYLFTTEEAINSIINVLKKSLNQEAILKQTENIDGKFC